MNATKSRQLKLINDVLGYTHLYESTVFKGMDPPFFGKTRTDYEFYTHLINTYQFRNQVESIMAPYAASHTIIGIHVRAGNGESGNFEEFRQLGGAGNLEGWLHNLTSLLQYHVLLDESLVAKKENHHQKSR